MLSGPALPFFQVISEVLNTKKATISPHDLIKAAEKANILESGASDSYEKSPEKMKAFNNSVTEEKMLLIINLVGEVNNINFEVFRLRDGQIEEVISVDSEITNFQSILIHSAGFACILLPNLVKIEIKETILNQITFKNDFPDDGKVQQQKIILPSFLEEFVINQIMIFIESALEAKQMNQKRHYLTSESDVIPIDFDSSGVIQKNQKWGEGLQQFIELKEASKMSCLSLITNFLSNVALFNRYLEDGSLYGVTGTLGGPAENNFLKRTYPLELIPIPTNKIKKLYEMPATITNDSYSWRKSIVNKTLQCVKNKRTLLIICEDILTVSDLEQLLKLRLAEASNYSIVIYTRDDLPDESNTIKKAFKSGDIILATNLAGRGTNIILDGEVQKCGGLHVLLTFLPRNRRVELQAFGRAARQGAPGSCEVLFDGSKLPASFKNKSIQKIRELVNEKENENIMRMANEDMKQGRIRETLFKFYCENLKLFYLELKNKLNDKYQFEAQIDSVNEWWAYWLQMNTKRIKAETIEETQHLLRELKSEIEKVKLTILDNCSPTQNPYHIIKYANQIADKSPDEAIIMYSKAIELSNCWSLPAFYNRAYCRLKKAKGHHKVFIETIADLKEADKRIDFFTQQLVHLSAAIQVSVQSNSELARKREEITVFDQLQTRGEHYSSLKNNIVKAITILEDCNSKESSVDIKTSRIFDQIPSGSPNHFEETLRLSSLGFELTFSVKERPKFCWAAFWVMMLGVLEAVAGAALCIFSVGALTTVGMGLIIEGVSDIIDGIEGMIKGKFSLKDWAIKKAISIAISIACAGIKVVMRAGMQLVRGARAAVMQGSRAAAQASSQGIRAAKNAGVKVATAKMKMSIAVAKSEFSNELNAAKNAFNELKAIRNVASQGLTDAMKKNAINAGKLIGKVMVKQGVMKVVDFAESKILKTLVNRLKEKVKEAFKEKCRDEFGKKNSPFKTLFLNISENTFENMAKCDNEVIKRQFLQTKVKALKELYSVIAENTVAELIQNSARIKEITNYIYKIKEHLVKNKSKGSFVIEGVMSSTIVITTLNKLNELSEKFFDEFSNNGKSFCKSNGIILFEHPAPNCLTPEQLEFLKYELVDVLANVYSASFETLFEDGINSQILRGFSKSFNSAITKTIADKLNTGKTIELLNHGAKQNALAFGPLNQSGKVKTSKMRGSYADKLVDENTTGSLCDLRILAESEKRKVDIYEKDSSGKLKMRIGVYPTHFDKNEPPLKMLYHAPSSELDIGHYEALDGNAAIQCKGNNKSCLFEAFERAKNLNLSDAEILANASAARQLCARKVRENPSFEPLIRRRTEMTHKSYALIGGVQTAYFLNKYSDVDVTNMLAYSLTKNGHADIHVINAQGVAPGYVGRPKSYFPSERLQISYIRDALNNSEIQNTLKNVLVGDRVVIHYGIKPSKFLVQEASNTLVEKVHNEICVIIEARTGRNNKHIITTAYPNGKNLNYCGVSCACINP